MESYGALKQVDPRSTSDARAHDILENTTVHNGIRYNVGMLWAEGNIENCPTITSQLFFN